MSRSVVLEPLLNSARQFILLAFGELQIVIRGFLAHFCSSSPTGVTVARAGLC
ncbi:MAG: hypothetical protein KJ072_20545 [Verrucomicrobia bacterium]|nr:hypothetical protein [Verrucomicrobiota bacterium]